MKLKIFLLSFYFLSLNLILCTETSLGEDCSQTELSEHSNSGDEDTPEDSCTPFCQCHCCSFSFLDFGPELTSEVKQEIPTEHFGHPKDSGQEISLCLFQPPRV